MMPGYISSAASSGSATALSNSETSGAATGGTSILALTMMLADVTDKLI